jgi:tetratricopeptide (TPR) repeat protein
VLLGVAIAPMLVAGRAPVEQPAPATAIPELPTMSGPEQAVRSAIERRIAATAAGDLHRLAASVTALEAALPQQQGAGLATVENELGLAKRLLAQESGDEAVLAEAVAHYRRALSGFGAPHHEDEAAAVRWNLAIALHLEGGMRDENAPLREAAELLRDLVASDDPALDRREANRRLGQILLVLGETDNSIRVLVESVTALEAALVGADQDGRDRLAWAETQNALATALQALGEREWSLARLEAALKARRNAWVLYQSAGLDTYRFYFDTRIAALEELIETRRTSPIRAANLATP